MRDESVGICCGNFRYAEEGIFADGGAGEAAGFGGYGSGRDGAQDGESNAVGGEGGREEVERLGGVRGGMDGAARGDSEGEGGSGDLWFGGRRHGW